MHNRSGFGARSGSSVILVDYFDSLVKLPATVVQKAEKYTLAIIPTTTYICHEPWEIGVHKRNGVVYLDVHKLLEKPQSDLDRRR
ncbi:hypothetical protein JHK86_006593 [Glycine max]|nr:hypothetical protein JHK86_006593 [Glycine max]